MFDKYWQETFHKDQAKYYANVLSVQDSIWTLEYFQKDHKLFSGQFSGFYPNVKNGAFIAYSEKGLPRKKILFEEDKMKQSQVYYQDGKLRWSYDHEEVKQVAGSFMKTKTLELLDTSGVSVKELSYETGYQVDEMTGRKYTSIYENGELSKSYFIRGVDTVYQLTDPAYDFSLKKIQNKFNAFMSTRDYEMALADNAQGIVLLVLVIDKKGKITSCEILNTMHPEIDQLIRQFKTAHLQPDSSYKIRFKPYQRSGQKAFLEVVIPIAFGVNRFYRPINDYHLDPFMRGMNPQIMHDQMIQNIQLPPMPSMGF